MLHYNEKTKTLTDADGNVVEGPPHIIHHDSKTGRCVSHSCRTKDGLSWEIVARLLSHEKLAKNKSTPSREEVFAEFAEEKDLLDRLWIAANEEAASDNAGYGRTEDLGGWANEKLSDAIRGDQIALETLCRLHLISMPYVALTDGRRSLYDRVDSYNSTLLRAHQVRLIQEAEQDAKDDGEDPEEVFKIQE